MTVLFRNNVHNYEIREKKMYLLATFKQSNGNAREINSLEILHENCLVNHKKKTELLARELMRIQQYNSIKEYFALNCSLSQFFFLSFLQTFKPNNFE